jgi:ATP-dependent protease ClpP protease subunit
MAKEILIYSPIFDFVAENFISQLNDSDGKDVTVRVNSPGGSVFAGWGMIAKSQEHQGNITVKVDGNASSMAAIFLLFHKNVEALNVTTFTLHRASVPFPTDEEKKQLKGINADIRRAFEAKLNIAELENISGVLIDDFFNSEEVIDINLNALQAKQIGLIDTINEMDASAFDVLSKQIAAISNKEIKKNKQVKTKTNIKMDIKALKSDHPALFAEVVALGEQKGVSAERDRVGAWMAFGDVDFQAVTKGIKDGEDLTATATAELSRKSFAAQAIADIESDNAEEVETEQESEIDEPTAVDKFMTAVVESRKTIK